MKKNKYSREIKPGVFVDVYDVLKAFDVTCPALAHGVKKCLAPGQRGVKDSIQDKNEAIASITRSIEIEVGGGDLVFAGRFEGRDIMVTPDVKRAIEYLGEEASNVKA